jgi:hypothetical protein
MPISFACAKCGRKLKAPDEAAGKSSKCPGCGAKVTCPAPGQDAGIVEMIVEGAPAADPYGDLDAASPYGLVEPEPAAATAEERRPCPMCGELILATAAKCRFCGEIFDPALKKAKGTGKSRKRAEMRSIASNQRYLIRSILVVLLSYVGVIALVVANAPAAPRGAGLAVLGVLYLLLLAASITATVFAFRLALRVYSTGVGVTMGILTLLGCIGLIVLLIINGRATKILRENGYSVGFLGADLSEFR